MFTANKELVLAILSVIILNLSCGISAPTEGSEDALATQVQRTLAEHAAQQPSETDEAPLSAPSRLLLLDGESLFSLDAHTMEAKPLQTLDAIPEADVFFDPVTMSIVYRDENALRVLDLVSGEERFVLADQRTEDDMIRYTPLAWMDTERVLVQQYDYVLDASEYWSYTSQIGWLTISTGVWQVLPSLEDSHIPMDCNAGLAISPDGHHAALTLNAHGLGCDPLAPGLHILDLESGVIQTVISRQAESATAPISGALEPSWSPDGGWIAVTLYDVPEPSSEDHPFAGRLYILRQDGTDLSLLTDNASGSATSPIWGRSGQLYYGIVHSGEGSDGIFAYDHASQTTTTLVDSTAAPAGISQDETVMVFMDNIGISHELKLLYLSSHESYDIPAPSGEKLLGLGFLGWLPQE